MKRLSRCFAMMLIMLMCAQLITMPVSASSATPMMGEIRIFAGDFAPRGWALCYGQLLPIAQNQALFSILGTTYGGDGRTTFALPDLRGRIPVGVGQGPGLASVSLGEIGGVEAVALTASQMPAHSHTAALKLDISGSGTLQSAGSGNTPVPEAAVFAAGARNEKIYSDSTLSDTSNVTPMKADGVHVNMPIQITETSQISGGSRPHNNMEPYAALNYIIALQGLYPSRDSFGNGDAYTGEITMFAGNYEPSGWQFCDGRTVQIRQNTALFSLLGIYYGGDGRTTFAYPDLRGRSPIGWGQGAGLPDYQIGELGGTTSVSLTTAEMPAHSHGIVKKDHLITGTASMDSAAGSGNTALPANAIPARGQKNEKIYSTNPATTGMKSGDVALNLSVANPNPAPATSVSGTGQPHENRMPYLGIHFIINPAGNFPPREGGSSYDDYIGMVGMYAFNFAPGGTALCGGQNVDIDGYNVLFSLLGTTFGGDGQNTFALPNLKGRVPLGTGSGPGLSNQILGQVAGEAAHVLMPSEMPAHYHDISVGTTITGTGTVNATDAVGNTPQPGAGRLSKGVRNERIYSNGTATQTMNDIVLNLLATLSPRNANGDAADAGVTTPTGSGQSHLNMKPYLGITFAVTEDGIYPSRN